MTGVRCRMDRKEKIEDIRANPGKHRHSFEELRRCCISDGAIDMGLMEAHEVHAPVGENGGRRCDVTSGPCSCGTTH